MAKGVDNSLEQALRIQEGTLSAPVALVMSRFCKISFTSTAVVFMHNNKFGLTTSMKE